MQQHRATRDAPPSQIGCANLRAGALNAGMRQRHSYSFQPAP